MDVDIIGIYSKVSVMKKNNSIDRISNEEGMEVLNNRRELHSKILDRLMLYGQENELEWQDVLVDISVVCSISESLINKVVNGSREITRDFLYRFVVGLDMSLKEADEYFALEKEGRLGSTNEIADKVLIDNIKKHEGIIVLLEELIKWDAIDKEEQKNLREERKKKRGRPKKNPDNSEEK